MQNAVQQMVTNTSGFLTDIQYNDAGLPGLVLLAGRYDQNRFSPALFDMLGITCPASLRTASPRRLAEFLAGRAIAKAAIGVMGVAATDIPIGADRRPQWPETIVGSISHARGHMACLVGQAHAGHPGIDIETIAGGQALAAIHKIALTDADRAQIAPLPADQAAQVATMIFSGKEALFKALFPMVGKTFGFAAAEMVSLPDAVHLNLRLTADLTPDLRAGSTFPVLWQATTGHVMTWLAARDVRSLANTADPDRT